MTKFNYFKFSKTKKIRYLKLFQKAHNYQRVLSFEKGLAVEKFRRINDLNSEEITSVGDSGSDLSMRIQGSSFIGFNPSNSWSREAFEDAGVPVVNSFDLREIWPILMDGEQF